MIAKCRTPAAYVRVRHGAHGLRMRPLGAPRRRTKGRGALDGLDRRGLLRPERTQSTEVNGSTALRAGKFSVCFAEQIEAQEG